MFVFIFITVARSHPLSYEMGLHASRVKFIGHRKLNS